MSPAEIVDQYTEQVYHQRDLTSLDMLVADPMIRHEPDGSRLALTIEEAKLRITSFHQQFRSMRFSNRKIIQDQEVLGYRVVSIAEMMDALRFLDSLKIGEDVEDDEDQTNYEPAYYQWLMLLTNT